MTSADELFDEDHRSGTIGPFTTTADAYRWWAERVAALAALAGQDGAPTVRFDPRPPRSWTGTACSGSATYQPWPDRITLHYGSVPTGCLDLAVVDGMLLHALGHRARRRTRRAVDLLGGAVAAAGLVLTGLSVRADTATPALLAGGALWALVGLAWLVAVIRGTLHAENWADDYALACGGPRPILAYLHRSAASAPGDHLRLQRLQQRLWDGSTLTGPPSPRTRPPTEPGSAPKTPPSPRRPAPGNTPAHRGGAPLRRVHPTPTPDPAADRWWPTPR